MFEQSPLDPVVVGSGSGVEVRAHGVDKHDAAPFCSTHTCCTPVTDAMVEATKQNASSRKHNVAP
jgi:hypothetical protein